MFLFLFFPRIPLWVFCFSFIVSNKLQTRTGTVVFSSSGAASRVRHNKHPEMAEQIGYITANVLYCATHIAME